MGIRLYNKVPINIKKLEEYNPHKREMKSFLIYHVFLFNKRILRLLIWYFGSLA